MTAWSRSIRRFALGPGKFSGFTTHLLNLEWTLRRLTSATLLMLGLLHSKLYHVGSGGFLQSPGYILSFHSNSACRRTPLPALVFDWCLGKRVLLLRFPGKMNDIVIEFRDPVRKERSRAHKPQKPHSLRSGAQSSRHTNSE